MDGSWPSPIAINQGWGRATARPWNDTAPDAFLRLERGRADFLATATRHVGELSGAAVFSPAMFPGSTRIWARAGYHEVRELEVMERLLSSPIDKPLGPVSVSPEPDWARILEIDSTAFHGFWRMSLDGLLEALESTTPSAVLTIGRDSRTEGYAIVGAQWGVSYLQRVAVDPGHTGRHLGTDLVVAALLWARQAGARSMVLNVRAENTRAKRVYERQGFTTTGDQLRILRYGESALLS